MIEAPRARAAVPSPKAQARARALLDKVGIAHRADAYPARALGRRAAARRDRARAGDEPEGAAPRRADSALDPDRGARLAELLRGLVADGLTLLCVSHDPDFAREILRARVLVMVGGKIAAAAGG